MAFSGCRSKREARQKPNEKAFKINVEQKTPVLILVDENILVALKKKKKKNGTNFTSKH